MTKENEQFLWLFGGVCALALVLYWLEARRYAEVEAVAGPSPSAGFYAPYYWSTPGIYDNPAILNGATAPFESVVNVFVDNPAFSGLANQYIPMFGFVGMTAVSAS